MESHILSSRVRSELGDLLQGVRCQHNQTKLYGLGGEGASERLQQDVRSCHMTTFRLCHWQGVEGATHDQVQLNILDIFTRLVSCTLQHQSTL
jgi:hypothetical protein